MMMTSIANQIMKRMRAKGRGKWVCTPKDFLNLGSRASVDQALSRLAKSGYLRRIGCGLYDLPRMSSFLKEIMPAKIDIVVDALIRRDGIRVMPNGIVAANGLGLTNAVPAKVSYWTDGATRNIKVGRRTFYFQHVGPKVMSWFGRPSAPVAQALYWLGPMGGLDVRVEAKLKRNLPDDLKKDLIQNSANLPPWSRPLVRNLIEPQTATR